MLNAGLPRVKFPLCIILLKTFLPLSYLFNLKAIILLAKIFHSSLEDKYIFIFDCMQLSMTTLIVAEIYVKILADGTFFVFILQQKHFL